MTNGPVWLNSACLGPSNIRDGQLDTLEASSGLLESYRRCTEWVTTWCGVGAEQVLLTSGATDACDTALTTRNGLPTWIVYSDLAHECTRSSVVCAADFLGAICGRTVAVAQVKISDLFALAAGELAAELARRVGAICGAARGVLARLSQI